MGADPFATLVERLGALAELSDQVRAAITADASNVAGIRRLIEDSRRAHVLLASANMAIEGLEIPPAYGPMLPTLRGFTERIRRGDTAISTWLARPMPPESELLTSAEGVVFVADALFSTAWDHEKDVLIILGRGGDRLVSECARRGQARIIVFVPAAEPGSAISIEEEVTPPPHEAVLVRGLNELTSTLENFPGLEFPDRAVVKRLHDPAVTDELAAELGRVTQETIENAKVGRNTVDFLGETWVLQGVANLPYIAAWPSVNAVGDAFAGKPCVIVSPGPSLAKNVHLLKELKGRALIITVNRAVAALHRAGVVPDLVMMLDPLDLRYHFEGVPVESIGGLVLGATVHPDIYRFPVQRIFTFAANSQLDDWIFSSLGETANLPSGGSVSCSAASLAMKWGCDPIILVGQDLAFSDDQYYVSTTSDGGMRVRSSGDGRTFVTEGYSAGLAKLPTIRGARATKPERILHVRGYYGGTVATSFMLQLFLRWFAGAAKTVTRMGRSLVNCTEGGAYIEGAEHLSLADAIGRYARAPFDVTDRLDAAVATNPRALRLRKMLAGIEEMIGGMERCLAEEANCSRLAAQGPAGLEEAERRLVAALQPVLFMSLLGQKAIRAALAASQKAKSIQASLAASRELFRVVRTGGEMLLPQLQRSRTELLAMLEQE